MIELYTWSTPNGRKVSILLEELGVPYNVHPVDIGKDEQFAPDFLKIAPNNRIPAIVDRDTGLSLMESGAIMFHLAQKHGQFLGAAEDFPQVMEWLMWQMGGFGPMLGQAHHFLQFNPEASDYAAARYGTEAQRLYGVLDRQLGGRDYVAGAGRGAYTIADMAIWPWAARFEWHRVDLRAFPNMREWYLRIADREAVQRGYQVPVFAGEIPRP
ncbi:MAG: glutathione S-transferase N-terminal domain-containing protein [Silicimonas sp.]|jgi:GST-like protein|nr:glutathione S-transferase N-terminal domain-containing protein [Silicimonas sp.]